MPIKLKANNGNIDLKAPIKQVGGAVDSVNGMTGDVVLDIPSKTSDLVNDSGFVTETELDAKGYLTEHQDLSNYYNKSEVDTAISDVADSNTFYVEVVDNKVTTPIAEYYAAFQEGKRVVLNNFTSSFGTEYNYVLTYCTSASAKFCSVFPNYTSGIADGIQLRFATVSSDGTISVKYFVAANKTDLNNYYTQEQVNAKIPSKLSQLTNDVGYAKSTDIPDVSGFITDIPEEYITETELTDKGYQTATQVQALIDTAIASITDAEEVSY